MKWIINKVCELYIIVFQTKFLIWPDIPCSNQNCSTQRFPQQLWAKIFFQAPMRPFKQPLWSQPWENFIIRWLAHSIKEQQKNNNRDLLDIKNQFFKKKANPMNKVHGLILQILKVLLGKGLKQIFNFLLNVLFANRNIFLDLKGYAPKKCFHYR